MSIGSILREQRLKMGLTVAEAANLGGVARSYLSMVETGKRAPNPEILVRLTRQMDLATDAWLSAFMADERRCQRLVSLGRALLRERDYAAARRVLGSAFFVSRDDRNGRYNSEIYELLGKVYYGQGRYRRALRWFGLLDRAVRHAADAGLQAATSYNLAQCMAKTGREFEALARFDVAIAAFAGVQQWYELGLAWLAKANLFLDKRMYKEANLAYGHAAHLLRGKRWHDDAMLGVAITTWMVQGTEAAKPLLRRIIDSEGTDQLVRAKARSNLATVLREGGLYREAIREIEMGLASRDGIPGRLAAAMLTEAALSHLLSGDAPSALRMLEEYKALPGAKDGQDIGAMRILARVLGVESPGDPLPWTVEDEYDRRLNGALRILRTRVHSRGA